jgi:hypothetical protein
MLNDIKLKHKERNEEELESKLYAVIEKAE